jgi:hypothetical protein
MLVGLWLLGVVSCSGSSSPEPEVQRPAIAPTLAQPAAPPGSGDGRHHVPGTNSALRMHTRRHGR